MSARKHARKGGGGQHDTITTSHTIQYRRHHRVVVGVVGRLSTWTRGARERRMRRSDARGGVVVVEVVQFDNVTIEGVW